MKIMKNGINIWILSVSVALLFGSCIVKKEKEVMKGIESLDLSRNDKYLVYSKFDHGVGKIYSAKLNGDSVSAVLSSGGDTSYVRPKFSQDGRNILFLAFPVDEKSSNIFVADKYGNNKRRITDQDQIITEAIFSSDGKEIFYTKAETYESYSPIGRAAPHGLDIYGISLDSLRERKITNLRAYGINSLSEAMDQKYLLARLILADMGMYLISLKNPGSIREITPANNPRADIDLYDDPSYSKKFNGIVFTAPYELYVMDLKTKNAQLVYDTKDSGEGHIYNVIAFNEEKKILFRVKGDDAFRVIDFDGTNLVKIKLK